MPLSHVTCFSPDFHLRTGSTNPINFFVKTIFLLSALSIIAIFSSACNTTIGIGRDMRLLGEGIESSAQKTRGGDSSSESSAPVY